MLRRLLLTVLSLPVLGAPLAAQRPAAPTRARPKPVAAAADTSRRDTTAATDPLSKFLESFTYRALGPAAYSGRVTAIAVPRSTEPRPKTFYIGAAGGGVWKTTNGGVTWQSVSGGLGSETVGDLAVAPSDSNTVWVGTGEKNSLRSQYWGDGVYKSTDGAKSWTKMGLADSRSIGRIVIHPTGPDTVYVAALGHLWGPNPERGVYKTTDGGKTWVRLTDPVKKNGLPTDRIGRIGIAISPQNPKLVFAMIQVDRGVTEAAQGRFGGVFRSSDAGATWTQVNDLQAVPHYYYDEIWVDANDSQHVFVNSAPLLESKDGGRTFAPESLSRVHGDHHTLWFDAHDAGHRILGNDGGAYVTFDGGRAWWHMPIPIGQFYTVIVDSSLSPYQICGGLQDNGVWCGPSATRDQVGVTDADWYPVNGGDGMWVQVPPNDPWTVYSGWQFGNVSRLDLRTFKRDEIQPESLDAGTESGYSFTWGWTTPILISHFDSTTVYLGGNRLFRLRQHGQDWEALGPDMTRTPRQRPAPEVGHTSYHAIFSLAESPKTAAVLWTGTDDGLVWVSQDTGRTWANVTGNFPRGAPTECWVSDLVASFHAQATAWVVFDCHNRDDYRPHVWRTADFGKTWTELVAGLPTDRGSLTVFESPRNARVLWVGTSDGVYVTVDGAQRWRRFGKSFPHVMVERLAMSFRQHDLVVATHGRGLYIVGVGPVEEYSDSVLADTIHLFTVAPAYQYRERQTHPGFGSFGFVAANPPRGAVISYYLKEMQPDGVKLAITTTAGDTVRSLTGPGFPGLQRVTWDLNRDRPRPRGLGDPTSPEELRRSLPGEYVVRVTIGKLKLERRIQVEELPPDRLGRVR